MAKKKAEQSTALVPVELVKKTESEAGHITKIANTLPVKCAEDETKAYELLKNIKGTLKMIEDKRKEITAPLNASIKTVNEMFKRLAEPFQSADNEVRRKILEFRQAEEEKARKLTEKREAVQEQREAKGLPTKAVEPVAAKVAAVTQTAKRWTFQVIDEKKVPREYLCVDEGAIRQAVRNGVREILGVEIYQEEGLRV